MRHRVILSWSGGKDSALALAALRADPDVEVVALLTAMTADLEHVSTHGVRRELVQAQAAAAGLPLLEMPLPQPCSNVAYEAAFLAALARAQEQFTDVAGVAFGDLHLQDVRAYREHLLASNQVAALFPLWGRDTRRLAQDFIAAGHSAVLVCVDTTQLSGSLAGREFDARLLAELSSTADPCGEKGEFHTFVWRAPTFAHEIPIRLGAAGLRDGRFAYCELELVDDDVTVAGPRQVRGSGPHASPRGER
jgi:uncharacterized protein (TIGR00290 family)